jgi:hypothetical protein
MSRLVLANVDALGAEIFPGLRYLLHELPVCIWYVVEGEDSPAKFEEEVCAEGDERPKGKLRCC